jgi:tRNA(Ile)-lysidine synthase
MQCADLQRVLATLPAPTEYWVAYSAGVDSHALLHLLSQCRDDLSVPIKAVHVNHGLQEDAAKWAVHAQVVCDDLGIELVTLQVSDKPAVNQSIEAFAREQRYRLIGNVMPAEAMLLTAQHQDDQAETLILQLLRGAGVDGLASMPLCREFARGWLARPLLEFSQDAVMDYAKAHQLQWVDDPSNASHTYDRNYLRHQVMPVLKQRWPHAAQTMAKSASLLGEGRHFISAQLTEKLHVRVNQRRFSVESFAELDSFSRRQLLREWLRISACDLPDASRLSSCEKLSLSETDSGEVCWSTICVRRYAQQLWITPRELPVVNSVPHVVRSASDRIDLEEGRLVACAAKDGIPKAACDEGRVSIHHHAEGCRYRLLGREGERRFKQLCQELGIPSWSRMLQPLIMVDGLLWAIGNHRVSAPSGLTEDQSIEFQWESDWA